MVGRAAAYDLEAVPLVEANVGHCHLGGLERQAAKAARSRHLVDPLQQPAPDAAALSRRIDSDLVDVEVFLLRFRPGGTDDALSIQSDVDVAAREFRRKSLAPFGIPGRSLPNCRAHLRPATLRRSGRDKVLSTARVDLLTAAPTPPG